MDEIQNIIMRLRDAGGCAVLGCRWMACIAVTAVRIQHITTPDGDRHYDGALLSLSGSDHTLGDATAQIIAEEWLPLVIEDHRRI